MKIQNYEIIKLSNSNIFISQFFILQFYNLKITKL